MTELEELKKEVFYRLMDMAGKVYVLAKNSDSVVIGKRGFVGEEKEQGITLVFNRSMKFIWDDFGIKATLVFGSSAEKCEIPASEIVAIFSPELGIRFIVDSPGPERGAGGREATHPHEEGNVIKVDFKKKDA